MERMMYCKMKTNQRSITARASGVAMYVRLPHAGQAFGDRPDKLEPPM